MTLRSLCQVVAPNEFQGSVVGGINKRGGLIQNTDVNEDGSGCTVQADVPLAQVRVISKSGLGGDC